MRARCLCGQQNGEQTGGNTSTFYYGADRNKYRQVDVDGSVTEDRITVAGGMFEKLTRGSAVEYRHFVQIAGKPVANFKRSTDAANDDTFYLHEDHLGSTDVITNAAGAVVVRQSFDAWGQRRGSDWTGTPSAADKAAISSATHLGFTGHEQLDNLNLVHMKGRVYDPAIGRFMSADRSFRILITRNRSIGIRTFGIIHSTQRIRRGSATRGGRRLPVHVSRRCAPRPRRPAGAKWPCPGKWGCERAHAGVYADSANLQASTAGEFAGRSSARSTEGVC